MTSEFSHCYKCGTKLEDRFNQEENRDIPYCPTCNEYRFPIFSSAVSMIVINHKGDKILLIKQYHTSFYRFVAGYINKGENAEEAVVREIKEEIGGKVKKIIPNCTFYFEQSNTLMINYIVILEHENLVTNWEVDSYSWIKKSEIMDYIPKSTLMYKFITNYLDKEKNNEI